MLPLSRPRASRLTVFSALMLGIAALASCAPTTSARDGRTPAAEPAGEADVAGPVAVALLTPSSASNAGAAQLGQALENAARLAMADLNDPLLQLQVYDTGGDPARAAATAREAAAAGAALILGPLFAETTRAAAGAAAGLNVISFSTDSNIAGGSVFLSGFLPEMAARRITSFARSRGYEAIGVLYPETDYGRLALRGAETAVGPAIVVRTSYPRTNEGIPPAASEFAARVKQAGARGLLLAESGQGLQYVAAILGSEGLGSPGERFLGLGEWDARATLDSPELAGGWFPAADPAALKAFVDRYRARYGTVPPQLAVLGYDAVQIAGQMLADARRAGADEPFSREAITRAQGFRGAVGPIRFTEEGLGERGMAILEVGVGVFNVIDPAPGAFGAGT